MFFNDRAPPYFHARYGEFDATIDIDTYRRWLFSPIRLLSDAHRLPKRGVH
jgi:hypothetical protein